MPELMKKPISTTLAAPGSQSHSHNSNEPTSALEIVAPGQVSADTQMGQQLTEQYRRATSGMTEVLRFGGMMMQLREHLRDSTRGVAKKGNAEREGTGLKSWLKENAPDVKEATAYRFLNIAEEVSNGFENTSGLTFTQLATTSPEALPEPARVAQQELWDFVSGTSQRSWLDKYDEVEKKERGGFRPTKKNGAPRAEKRTDAEIARDEYEEHAPAVCRRTAETMVELLLLEGPGKERAWDILDDEELDKLKLQAHDLYEGALASQKRRKALRK